MKALVCLLALIAVSAGQDSSCQISFPKSFCLLAEIFGSIYSSDPTKPSYSSFVGQSEYLVNDTGDMETSVIVVNETLVFNDGKTGKQETAGWAWTLIEGDTAYITTKFGGVEHPCQMIKGVPFQPLSGTFPKLKQLNPVPGVPPDPNTPYVCQGGVAGTPGISPDMLVSVEYNHHGDGMDQLVYFSQLTNTTHLMSRVTRVLPLSGDCKLTFKNPCKHAEVSVGDIPKDYHDNVRRVMHRFH